ncbi:uncharacterized protein [Primulina eburnea]|uniref:uncharacterized protein isoform X1 n=2 Tax=Primulina eburnea TaxID=1245227 RepID=UPI003C6BF308
MRYVEMINMLFEDIPWEFPPFVLKANMERKGDISDYRSKLDNTLASPDLTNDETIKTLLKNQILESSYLQFEVTLLSEYLDNVVERKSKEVSDFLEMLRSATKSSSKDLNRGWKVKEETEEFRVMYREGPEGTPFHSLLIEGYVDGPLDVCLCISWESGLYQKWLPQISIPTFKVVSSQCLRRIRTSENISLVRMKVPWPLSSREALLHGFTFEYFEDGLIVVLLNSISDSETIDIRTHGFTRDGIPDAQDVVRIGLVGGFALQKVTADRSFFRTIANMDIKLDFVPPALINFISRQLLGSGFKLYKKEVAAVSQGDEKFLEALNDPLYCRVREALFMGNTLYESPEQENLKQSMSIELRQKGTKELERNHSESNNGRDDSVIASEYVVSVGRNTIDEIEEFDENDTKGSKLLLNNVQKSCDDSSSELTERADKEIVTGQELEQISITTHEIAETLKTKNAIVSQEVEQALGTLEKIIYMYRETNGNQGIFHPKIHTRVNLEKCDVEESLGSEADRMCRKSENCEFSRTGPTETTSQELRNSSDHHASRLEESTHYSKGTNHSHNALASQDKSSSHAKHVASGSFMDQRTESPFREKTTENHAVNASANKTNGHVKTKTRNEKYRYCCFNSISGN